MHGTHCSLTRKLYDMAWNAREVSCLGTLHGLEKRGLAELSLASAYERVLEQNFHSHSRVYTYEERSREIYPTSISY